MLLEVRGYHSSVNLRWMGPCHILHPRPQKVSRICNMGHRIYASRPLISLFIQGTRCMYIPWKLGWTGQNLGPFSQFMLSPLRPLNPSSYQLVGSLLEKRLHRLSAMGVADDFRAGRSGGTGMVARLYSTREKAKCRAFWSQRVARRVSRPPQREDQREQAIPVLPGFNPGRGGRNMPRWR